MAQNVEEFIAHHGIKGQKWGVRNYQNKDGTLTEEGKKRYSNEKLFVSGSSKTQDKASPYYRRKLPKYARKELKKSIKSGDEILVGEAPGIDRQVQDFLNKKKYDNVSIYTSYRDPRYKANKDWKTKAIDASEHEEGSKEFLAKKDKAMTDDSTKGLAVVLDKGSSATKENVKRLISQNKKVNVWMLSRPQHKSLVKGSEQPTDARYDFSGTYKQNNGKYEDVFTVEYKGDRRYFYNKTLYEGTARKKKR